MKKKLCLITPLLFMIIVNFCWGAEDASIVTDPYWLAVIEQQYSPGPVEKLMLQVKKNI